MRSGTKVVGLAAAAACVALGAGAAFAAITTVTVSTKAALAADRQHATVTGTITCDSGDSVSLSANVVQVVGRLLITASGSTGISCSGVAQPWSVIAQTFGTTTLRLAPGKATVGVSAFDSTDFTSTGGNDAIRLTP